MQFALNSLRTISCHTSLLRLHFIRYEIPQIASSSRAQPLLRFPIATVRHKMTDTNQGGDPSKKTYHKKATGNALSTVKNHSKEDDLKLYGSAFW